MKKIIRGFGYAMVGFIIVFLFVFSVRTLFVIPSLSGYCAVAVFACAVFMLITDMYIMYKLGKGK